LVLFITRKIALCSAIPFFWIVAFIFFTGGHLCAGPPGGRYFIRSLKKFLKSGFFKIRGVGRRRKQITESGQSQMLQHILYLGTSLLLQSSFNALPCRICSAPSPRCIRTLTVVASTFIQGSSVSHLFGTIAAMHLIHIHYMLKQIGMHPLVSYARP
jgi:hypothetical protein